MLCYRSKDTLHKRQGQGIIKKMFRIRMQLLNQKLLMVVMKMNGQQSEILKIFLLDDYKFSVLLSIDIFI